MADDRDSIARIVRALGEEAREATDAEIERLRRFFAEVVLGAVPESYLLRKYEQHVELGEEWPDGTSPDGYLEALRAAVRRRAGGIRLARDPVLRTWNVFFTARSGRRRGGSGGPVVVVLFNGERAFWITGFQPARGLNYVIAQGGHWARRPG